MSNTYMNRIGVVFDRLETGNGMVRLSRGSYEVNVNEDDLQRWEDGEFVQTAFPYLDADQREFLLNGLTPDEFEALFPDE